MLLRAYTSCARNLRTWMLLSVFHFYDYINSNERISRAERYVTDHFWNHVSYLVLLDTNV